MLAISVVSAHKSKRVCDTYHYPPLASPDERLNTVYPVFFIRAVVSIVFEPKVWQLQRIRGVVTNYGLTLVHRATERDNNPDLLWCCVAT